MNFNQLLGEGFVLGASYLITRADLQTSLPEISASDPRSGGNQVATLQQLGGYLLYNHSCGFFARFDARYYHQSIKAIRLPGDSFVQLDIQVAIISFVAGWSYRSLSSISLTGLSVESADVLFEFHVARLRREFWLRF